jgi:hypothetical protein
VCIGLRRILPVREACYYYNARPREPRPTRHNPAAAPISRLLPIPDALAEAAEAETDIDEALDVPVPVSVGAGPDDVVEGSDTLTIVVVDSMPEVAAGLVELMVMLLLVGAEVDKGRLVDVVLN